MTKTNGRAVALPYQREGVRRIEAFGGRALLADDMGLGKTLQALWWLQRAKTGPTLPALVVCPASVKHGWEHEARTHTRLRPMVAEGRKPPQRGPVPTELPDLIIINPDILHDWVPYLRTLGLRSLVLDECQMYKNRRTKRTRAAADLARSVDHVLAMSGTPLTNRPSELWPTLNMVRPDVFRAFMPFAQAYCRPRRAPWGWTYDGADNLDKLHDQLVETCMVRRRKVDVLDQLPDKVRRVTPVDLSDPAEYDHALHDFQGWLAANHGSTKAKRASRAAALAQLGYLLRLTAKLKARSVVRWAQQWLASYPCEKLVLFAVHHKMVDVLARRVLPRGSVVVDGRTSSPDRRLAIQRFRTDPDIRVFIGNIQAAGTGVNGLQDVCSTAAFAELWWRPGDHVQAEDRLHRIGQDVHVWVHYLVAAGTIEDRLARLIQTKQQHIHATLDGQADVEALDIFDQLTQDLTK